MGHTHTDSLVDIIHWSHALCLWDPFSDICQWLWDREPFHSFRIGCFAKLFNGWLPLNVIAGWLCPTCVTGTWVTSWMDVILIWYHHIVICTLVTIFNWWLSSKDMKLQVSIKQDSLTHVSRYTALFTCERASSPVFGRRDNSRIIIYIYIHTVVIIMANQDKFTLTKFSFHIEFHKELSI